MKLAAFLAGAALAVFTAAPAAAQDKPGAFDFYVLSLSWMPSFCADNSASSQTCHTRSNAGFLLHGLWPQKEHGYPEYCAGRRPERIAAEIGTSMIDIMPDRRLVFSEWRKHGACSGLAPEPYFALARKAFERISIPASLKQVNAPTTLSAQAVEAAFVASNPGLTGDGIALSCPEGRIGEVRICMTRDLSFRTCPEVDARGCHKTSLAVPAPH